MPVSKSGIAERHRLVLRNGKTFPIGGAMRRKMQLETAEMDLMRGGPVLAECRKFLVKLAENSAELEQAFRLRYEVFKLEQGRMASLESRIDRDEFDDYCSHLLVIDRSSGRVVGTYRMQFGATALKGRGFYSEQEYEITGLRELAEKVLEVGRSCVDPAFRSGAVVAMLWEGIAEAHRRAGFRYMLGCVSLEHTNAAIGWALYEELRRAGQLTTAIAASPRAGFELARPAEEEIAAVDLRREIPPLFKGYLRIGAKVAGVPVLDREFGSIDYLVWFDFEQLPDKYVKHFNV